MDEKPWYAVRCYFRHGDPATEQQAASYEERILLVNASSAEHAIEKAEQEAKTYADSIDGVEYLNSADAYHIFANIIQDGTELYSLIRSSHLTDDEYLNKFFQTGKEKTQY